jgi:hypothetical protein
MEGWRIPFRRNLDHNDVQAWRELCEIVEDIDLVDSPDMISWHLEPSGTFSSRSLYLSLCKKPEVPLTKYLWSYVVPLKIKIFTWQLARGRLPSNDQILARFGPSEGKCVLCDNIEHVDHIFFQCPLAQFLWSGVMLMFKVDWHPSSRFEWFLILDSLSPKARRFIWTFFAAQCWAIWIVHNKFTIEGKFPR